MKFIHLSNVNLGMEPFESKHVSVDRASDTRSDFLKVLDVCRNEDVDVLFITGTLFARRPEEEELMELDERFMRLSGTRVFYAPGVFPDGTDNSVYSDFNWKSSIHIFTGESIQRIHVPRLSMEVTGVGYSEKSWRKVKPQGLTRGRKAAIQVLLLPFAGETPEAGSRPAEELKGLPFDYMGIGQKESYVSGNGNRVYAPGTFESAGFDDTDRHGFILGTLADEGRRLADFHCQFVTMTGREFLEIRVNANEEIRYQEVEEQIRQAIASYGENNIYRILISGSSSPSLYIMKDNLYQLGNIFDVIDDTDTDAVRSLLQKGSDEAAVARFVDQVLSEEDSAVKQKAIQYGIDALLELE